MGTYQSYTNTGGADQSGSQSPTTFSQMQRQGYARPPMPGGNRAQNNWYGSATGTNSYYAGPYAGQQPYDPNATDIPGVSRFTGAPVNSQGAQESYYPDMAPQNTSAGNFNVADAYTNEYNNQARAPQFNAPMPNANTSVPGAQQAILSSLGYANANNTASTLPNAPSLNGSNMVGGLDVNAELARQYGTSPVSANTQGAIDASLANPSGYNSDAVQASYKNLSGQIDDEFRQNQSKLGEEMASRGLWDSSIAGGRYSDLNVAKKSAQEQLATNLLDKQAQDYASARSGAISQGLQAGGLNAQNKSSNLAALTGQSQSNISNLFNQYNAGLTGATTKAQLGTEQLGNTLNANTALQGNNQTQFQNQNTNYGNALNAFGANTAAQQQATTNRDNILKQLFGIGQQGFQNDVTTEGLNQNAQSEQDKMLLAMLGL